MNGFTRKLLFGLCGLLLFVVVGIGIHSAVLSADDKAITASLKNTHAIASERTSPSPGSVSLLPTTDPRTSGSGTDSLASGTARPGPVKSKAAVHYKSKVAVLMYHDFQEDPKAKSISLEVFSEQLKALKDNGFHFISMDQFKAFKLKQGKVPDNAVLITFDDGYEDFYTVAYPILNANDIPATNSIIVHSTDTGNPGGNPHLTWDQMREMIKHGMSFYSHTYNQHFYIPGSGPALTSRYAATAGKPAETLDQYRKRIRDDLALADKRIHDELGTPTDVFCYPYGASNSDTKAVSIALGHKLDMTIKPGLNGPEGRMVYRINAGYKSISGKDLIRTILSYTKSAPAIRRS
jgi:biofilm PGA synthesis lipoprotein PgaB